MIISMLIGILSAFVGWAGIEILKLRRDKRIMQAERAKEVINEIEKTADAEVKATPSNKLIELARKYWPG